MLHFKRAVSGVLVGIVVILIAITIIFFARGYRVNLNGNAVSSTSKGVLVANSAPNNTQIYLNNKFEGLTSNNLYLSPGHYEVALKKEGYSDWGKKYVIKGEVVSRVDAQLFSSNPSLTPLTNKGIINPLLSPSQKKVAYFAFPEEDVLPDEKENGGIFVAGLGSQTLNIFRQRSLVIPHSQLPLGFVPKKTQFIFSNDEKNLLVFFYDEFDSLLSVLLVSLSGSGESFDATTSYPTLLNKWWQQRQQLQEKYLDTVKKKVGRPLKKNTYLLDLSPDKSKLLYFALSEAELPRVINPPLIGSVPTKEKRLIKPGNFYIYDKKEDKNFNIPVFKEEERQEILEAYTRLNELEEVTETDWFEFNRLFNRLIWYGDSRHVVYSNHGTISVLEHDGQNQTLVYSGPFQKKFLAATPDGKLIVLTNINPKKNKLADLYTVSVK